MLKEQKGFTLIEMTISFAILSILFVLGMTSYIRSQNDVNLKTAINNIVSTLDIAQSRTISSLNSSAYGVHFESSDYTIFKGSTYSATSTDNIVYTMPSNVEVGTLSLSGGGSDVLFDQLTGNTDNYGSVEVRLITDNSVSQTIAIAQSGKADILKETLTPSDTRVVDTRHVHFTYSQSVASAVTLTLDFPGYSATNVSFQSYLGAGGTTFDWSGTINVGGEDQTLRVSTHFIDPSYADFSIERDMRYNTKAVSISLDGENLINYSSLGAVSQGLSANVGAPQIQ